MGKGYGEFPMVSAAYAAEICKEAVFSLPPISYSSLVHSWAVFPDS